MAEYDSATMTHHDTTNEEYDKNGKGGYVRFYDNNKIVYKYILHSPKLEWASWTRATPYIAKR